MKRVLVRDGDFDACEDAVQEALLAAAVQWPAEGMPDNPRGWLITGAALHRAELTAEAIRLTLSVPERRYLESRGSSARSAT